MKNGLAAALIFMALLCACNEAEPISETEIRDAVPTSRDQERVVRQPNPDSYKVSTSGPLELDNARRLNLPRDFSGNSPPTISPDGIHFFTYKSRSGFWFGTIDASEKPSNATGSVSGTSLFSPHNVPFVWSEDANAMFGVRQEMASRGGWTRGPMSPILVGLDGQVSDLPELSHPAGGADRIYWAGGNGLALVEFGSRGGSYKPEIANPNPTIAFADVGRGRIIQSIGIPQTRDGESVERINAVDVRIDRTGKLFALLQSAAGSEGVRWFSWHQDRSLDELESLLVGDNNTPFAVSPDAKSVLIMHNLSATGIYTQCTNDCPPITPADGTVADLRDIKTGKIIWAIEGTAVAHDKTLKPTISDDGSLAIIAMPSLGDGSGSSVALLSMQDGRILQRLDGIPTFIDGMGFRDGGKSIWLSGQDLVLTYSLNI